jgi:hypothetical protein
LKLGQPPLSSQPAMLPPDLAATLEPLLARVAARLGHDPALRRELADLALAVARWLDPPAAAPSTDTAPAAEPAPPPLPAPAAPAGPPSPSVAELAARLFRPEPMDRDREPLPVPSGLTLAPLPTIAARCRLKAEAARAVGNWDAGAELIRRAKAVPDCYLWMLERDQPDRPVRVWEDLAGGFTAAAAAADLLANWDRPASVRGRWADRVLHLTAEAQSTLRSAVADARSGYQDNDQVQLFAHVREAARQEQVFVRQYLRNEDLADPAGWRSVADRIAALAGEMAAAVDRERVRAKALSNLRYKARRLADGSGDLDEWRRAIELTDELVSGGLPPSNIELREALHPLFDRLADWPDLPPAVERVLREIDRYRSSRPAAEPDAPEAPTAEVAEVAGLLGGRAAVLIGGVERPDRKAALVRAFGLSDLYWLDPPEHSSVSVFEAPVARPEVAVVLLATRWCSHDYQKVKDYCDEYGKLFVKLPAGYHPNQVAHQILRQVGGRLRAAAAG